MFFILQLNWNWNKVKLAIQIYFNVVNVSLKELYCVIPSLPVSREYKNEVTGMQNPVVKYQPGKSKSTVNSENIL